MKSDFLIALTQLAAERGLPREMVLGAIEAALASAYKRDNLAAGQNIAVSLSPGTGDIRVYVLKSVVGEVEDDKLEMTRAEAKKMKPDAEIGDIIRIESTHNLSGRIIAQTAKQMVMQRLREAERELVFEEYSDRSEDVVTGTVQRIEARQTIVDLGRTEAVLPDREQVSTERYRQGQKMKFYIVEVARTAKGPEILISRSHRNLLKRLFEMEVPEIYNGIVEIKAIAREPGSRSKVAVVALQEGVDAVGSCVGLRGIRIQNIVNELQGEKIDVVQWHRDPSSFISNALNPSQALYVSLNEEENNATVVVQDKQLSLAIGREGQNARLAAKLTGWKIDILSSADVELERLRRPAPAAAVAKPVSEAKAPAEPVEVLDEKVEVEPVEAADAAVPAAELEPVEAEMAEPAAEEQPVVIEVEEEAPAPVAIEDDWSDFAIEEEEAEEVEEVEEIPLTDDIWQVPQLTPTGGGSQIRFAEDLIVPRGGEGRRGKGGRRGKRRKGAAT